MTHQFITQELRDNVGRYTPATDRWMINAGIERMDHCQACGHKIKHHYGVIGLDGSAFWVGSECVKILTGDNPTQDIEPGTRYTDNGRDYILPTQEWIDALRAHAIAIVPFGGPMPDRFDSYCRYDSERITVFKLNRFLADILASFERYGQLTVRQFGAASRTMGL